ncbi:hypothetical protein ONZ45_g9184 [Pleurotus djamor]|nr:hypothetical protein ONZ45_g9184 [Pleurotus djamor]
MSTKQGFINGYVLPGIIFPVLTALGVRYLSGSFLSSGLGDDLAKACSASDSPYLHHVSGLHGLDGFLCNLVAFFHAILEPKVSPVLMYFMGTAGGLMAFPLIEAQRQSRPLLLAFPMIVGLLGQSITIGLTMTLYWPIFIWRGSANLVSHPTVHVTQADAEAIVFATFVGTIIPSVGLMVLRDPTVTALWQIFPMFASAAFMGHKLFRPSHRHSQSGYKTIRTLYIGSFIAASSMHLAIVGPKLFDVPALLAFFPSTSPLPLAASLTSKTEDFLKWDLVFAFGSSILGTLWFARDAAEVLTFAIWHAFAIPLFGPGASMTAIFLWRESVLNDDEVQPDPRAKTS